MVWRLGIGLVVMLSVVAGGMRTAQGAKEDRVRCAVIADARAGDEGCVKLLESRLMERKDLAMVERGEINRVLRERTLQALLAPEGVKGRAEVGGVLKANVLVLVKAGKGASLEVAVCETVQGLRLLAGPMELSKDGEKDAGALEHMVDQALQKLGEKQREICAVPPFVCKDLGYEYEHLKGAYAKVVEQLLLERPGVLLVELAEADAIARELAISEGADISRKLPLYVLGEFRHERSDEKREQLTLVVKRGSKELARHEEGKLKDEDVPQVLRDQMTALLEKTLGREIAPPNAKVEAKELAARAHVFLATGNADEALPLAEASLLLQSDQWEVHREANWAICMKIKEIRTDADWRQKHSDEAKTLYRRSFFHTEQYLSHVSPGGEHEQAMGSSFAEFDGLDDVDVTILCEARETACRIIYAKQAQRVSDNAVGLACYQMHWRIKGESNGEVLAKLAKVLLDCPDAMGSERIAVYFMTLHTQPDNSPEWEVTLETLRKSDHPVIKGAVKQLVAWRAKLIAQRNTPYVKPEAPKRPPAVANSEVDNFPIKFEFYESNGQPNRTIYDYHLLGWEPVGKGVDMIWTESNMYLMREKGKAVFLTNSVSPMPCFDGKYIWTLSREKTARMFIIDPVTGDSLCITEKDGLPKGEYHSFVSSPLEPGKIMAAGDFGRMWVAKAQADFATKKVKFEIVLEAKNVQVESDNEAWKDIHLATELNYMYTLSEVAEKDGKPGHQTVLLGRHSKNMNFGVDYHPLIINPENQKVVAAKDLIPWLDSWADIVVHDGAAYYWEHTGGVSKDLKRQYEFGIFRVAPPDCKPVETGIRMFGFMPHLSFSGDKMNVSDWEWYTADSLRGPLIQRRTNELPPGAWIRKSEHYGTILLEHSGRDALELRFHLDEQKPGAAATQPTKK